MAYQVSLQMISKAVSVGGVGFAVQNETHTNPKNILRKIRTPQVYNEPL